MPREPKLQRWTDLIAALLRRRYPVTFEDLSKDVPAYQSAGRKKDAIMRMFERDKDELRAFGISIDTIPAKDEGEAAGYRLDRKGFYLPYLSLAAGAGRAASSPRKPSRPGYFALASLMFEPDELQIIAEAAQRVRSLGDPVLTEDAESAIRKLSFDLPVPRVDEVPGHEYVAMASMRVTHQPDTHASVFESLNDALLRRKRVTFDYDSMSSGQVSRRDVEPYGLFFLSSHWYLAARDVDKEEMRNFRLSRMSNVAVNTAKAQSTDYEIPGSFKLQQHARSKQPWELGEGDRNEAIVDFIGSSGATRAAAKLGTSVEGASDRRKFRYRRLDAFARWLLSFGGEAIPVSPEGLVEEFNRQVDATRAVYAEAK